jgi:hypothetical protein
MVDDTITPLAQTPLWARLLAGTEREPKLTEILGTLIRPVLYLALRHQTPTATVLTEQWFTNPTGSEAARQAIGHMRSWMELPPDRIDERKRAFELTRLAIVELINVRDSARDDHDSLRVTFMGADTIASELYFASGAHATGSELPKVPDREFAKEAFETLRMLSVFKNPSTVHHIVQAGRYSTPSLTPDGQAPATPFADSGDFHDHGVRRGWSVGSAARRTMTTPPGCIPA